MTRRAPASSSIFGTSPPIKAVLFDVDGTMYRQGPLRALMALELATLPLSGPTKVSARLKALSAYRKAQEVLRHRPSAGPAQAQLVTAASSSGLPVAEVAALVDEWMMRRPLKYLPYCRASGLNMLLTRLEEVSIQIGVLSDYPAEGKLRALGLDGRFSVVLSAADAAVAAFKPSPAGYLRACALWGLTPADVLFVGDRAEVDAAGAAAAGMRCAIIGPAPSPDARAGDYVTFPSLERLGRVFDDY